MFPCKSSGRRILYHFAAAICKPPNTETGLSTSANTVKAEIAQGVWGRTPSGEYGIICSMKTIREMFAAAVAAICAFAAFGYEANLNIDWRFTKGSNTAWGLDAALADAATRFGGDVTAPRFDDSTWELVSVPHCVNAHDTYDNHAEDRGEAQFWRGWMFYRKSFKVPEGKHFFIEFETVRQSIYLYVNGKFAGFYEAGITASGYDLTPFVKPGETAQITVVTENTGSRGTKFFSNEMKDKPGDWAGQAYQWGSTDFNPIQGGLVGNVKLTVKKNDSYITLPLWNALKTKGCYIWADNFDFEKGEADIHVEAEAKIAPNVSRPGIRATVAGQTIESKAGADALTASGRVKGLKFWSPDTPNLYTVKVELLNGSDILDAVSIQTGFRKVEFTRESGLMVNGKYCWLPGYAQRSTDSWAAIGYAPDWLQDYDANLIRASGANFVRWMHVAPKPGPVRAFDKAGVVCVCPAGDKESETKGRAWEQRMEAMEAAIIYFRNSPSVFFWEAGNNQISGEHMKEMHDLKQRLDPHGWRFMGCRTLKSPEQLKWAEYVGTMIHRHDVAAFDSMVKLGKFLPVVETEYCREESPRRSWDRFSPPDFNFVCKRLASGAKQSGYNCYVMTQEDYALSNASINDGYGYFYGNRAGGGGRLGQYYAACAMLCWTDCNQHGRNSDTENCRSSGRVDAVRIPKESFYVHKVMYSRKPKVKILGHWNYPKKTADNYWYNEQVNDGTVIAYTGERKQRDPEHKTVYVMGSLSVDSVKLFVNGRLAGEAKAPANLFDFRFPGIDVTEPGKVTAIGYDKAGNEVCRDEIETVDAAAKMEMKVTTGPKGLLADGSDIAMVDLKLVDAKGRVLPLASERVDFELSGPAVFMGGWNSGTFDETSPVGKNFVNFECGLARVFVKAGRKAGEAILKAKCANGLAASVKIPIAPVDVKNGIALTPPQSFKPNIRDYTVENPAEPVRDLAGGVSSRPYKVFVNGRQIAFNKRSKGAFKPDDSTGVVCPYMDVLEALKEAGVQIETQYSPKKIPAGKKYLRTASASPYRATLTMKAKGGKEIDAIGGLTVLFENNGEDKNLTNFEMTDEHGILSGELGPLLGYIPGLVVTTDDKTRRVDIKTK